MRVYKEQVCSSVQIRVTARVVPLELRSIKVYFVCMCAICYRSWVSKVSQAEIPLCSMTLSIAHSKN